MNKYSNKIIWQSVAALCHNRHFLLTDYDIEQLQKFCTSIMQSYWSYVYWSYTVVIIYFFMYICLFTLNYWLSFEVLNLRWIIFFCFFLKVFFFLKQILNNFSCIQSLLYATLWWFFHSFMFNFQITKVYWPLMNIQPLERGLIDLWHILPLYKNQ